MADALFDDSRLAAILDALEPDRSDLDAYVAMLEEFGVRSVLDLGCGTGIFALLLSARGMRVTGVDPARASLDVARQKPGADRVTWIDGDAAAIRSGVTFDAATMTANVAQVFLTDADWLATLTAVRGHLRPGGWLIFESRDPARRAWDGWTEAATRTTTDIPGVGAVTEWVQVTAVDEERGLVTFESPNIFEANGTVIVSRSTLRFRSREALEESLRASGFAVEEVRDAPDRPGREFVFVARRRRTKDSGPVGSHDGRPRSRAPGGSNLTLAQAPVEARLARGTRSAVGFGMRATIIYGPGDVRVEERDDPQILEPTDAILRLALSCICGSDLWPWRGIDDSEPGSPMGHEYAGTVVEVGSEVTSVKPGQFVVGSFFASDNTCVLCQSGYQTSCVNRQGVGGSQAELMRVPLADGTLVATPGTPSPDLIPSLLAASDVLGTGWFGAVAAEAGPGKTVAVVGDGAVGLLAILAAERLGAERIIAMSRHADRQRLARDFGATDTVEERGDDGVARVKELTDGLGAHSVVEAVGTEESIMQAIRATRPGGHVGYVGVLHGTLPANEVFFSHAHLHGGPAPVRRFLPQLIDLIWKRAIDPGKVFDLELPLNDAADGYRAMDERRATKVLLRA